jgi:hypothetical protein
MQHEYMTVRHALDGSWSKSMCASFDTRFHGSVGCTHVAGARRTNRPARGRLGLPWRHLCGVFTAIHAYGCAHECWIVSLRLPPISRLPCPIFAPPRELRRRLGGRLAAEFSAPPDSRTKEGSRQLALVCVADTRSSLHPRVLLRVGRVCALSLCCGRPSSCADLLGRGRQTPPMAQSEGKGAGQE